MYKVYVRDTDLTLTGELKGFTKLEVNLTYGLYGVSSWTVSGPASGHMTKLYTPGRGLVVVDKRGLPLHSSSGVLIAGDVEDDGPHSWSSDSAADASPGSVQLSGADDLAVVEGEQAFPDPTLSVEDQGATTYDSRSGKAETVIKGYVGDNVGVSRTVARGDADVPDARLVTVAPDLARGSDASFKATFDPLMDILKTVGQTSTPQLAPRVTQVGSDLVFDVYAPVDRSADVRFSKRRKNLRAYSVSRSAPTVTHVVVAGGDTGTGRAYTERKDATAANQWRRIRRSFVDQRQTTTVSELQAAGDEELARGRRSGVLSATAVDLPKMRFGEHFGLGDWVAVEAETGVVYVDQVTAVKITIGDKGVEPTLITIGNPDLDPTTPAVFARADRALQLIGELQRRTGG